ncbi:MAG: hypothetical protein IKX88_05715 [Thermoguttaceae bacterium]|nr:hypothetical protein [Thermoguttaceae bacterium]MBR5758073.1 hypothetical protein [Thermoguttaceae bacterium]
MSARKKAYEIFSRLNEKQLEGFIAMFGTYFTELDDGDDQEGQDDDLERRTRAFNKINSMTRPIPDLDEDKELREYFEEKYKI